LSGPNGDLKSECFHCSCRVRGLRSTSGLNLQSRLVQWNSIYLFSLNSLFAYI
jgi:hypothetical protein